MAVDAHITPTIRMFVTPVWSALTSLRQIPHGIVGDPRAVVSMVMVSPPRTTYLHSVERYKGENDASERAAERHRRWSNVYKYLSETENEEIDASL
jgi:hypothetical protein